MVVSLQELISLEMDFLCSSGFLALLGEATNACMLFSSGFFFYACILEHKGV